MELVLRRAETKEVLSNLRILCHKTVFLTAGTTTLYCQLTTLGKGGERQPSGCLSFKSRALELLMSNTLLKAQYRIQH